MPKTLNNALDMKPLKSKPFKPTCPSLRTDVPEVPPPDTCRYEGKGLGLALKEREPGKYAAVVSALANGLSLREVGAEYSMSKNTVGAIALRELGHEFVKKATVANLTQLVHSCSESLLGRLDEMNPTQLSIVMGIAQDKLLALDARQQPSMTLNHVNVTANISDSAVEALIAAATAKHTVSTQPIIDLTP